MKTYWWLPEFMGAADGCLWKASEIRECPWVSRMPMAIRYPTIWRRVGSSRIHTRWRPSISFRVVMEIMDTHGHPRRNLGWYQVIINFMDIHVYRERSGYPWLAHWYQRVMMDHRWTSTDIHIARAMCYKLRTLSKYCGLSLGASLAPHLYYFAIILW